MDGFDDKLTFPEVASSLGMSIWLLRGYLQDPTAPQLKVAFKVGNSHIYDAGVVEKWRDEFLAWRGQAPARAAARKAEADAAAARALAEEQDRLKLQRELIQGSIDAQAQAQAAFEARGKEIRTENERIARVQEYARGQRS